MAAEKKDFFGIESVIKTLNMGEDDARKMREAQQRLEEKRQDLKHSREPELVAGTGGILSGADQEPLKKELSVSGKQQQDLPLISPSQHRLIEEALMIQAEEAKEAGRLGYLARTMIQATMPHSDPGDIPVWGRRNGDFSLTIRPGYVVDKQNNYKSIGLPYGSMPRLLLSWISTEIVRTKERDLVLGNSLSDFLSQLGMTATGGRWGSITNLKKQARRLFSSTIAYTCDTQARFASGQFAVVDKIDIYWDPQDPHQEQLWQSTLRVSETIYNEVLSCPVPIDLRAIKALKKSPLALDIYCWLVFRMGYLKQRTDIPWEALQAQFGGDYALLSKFRSNFADQLRKVHQIYPEAKVDLDKRGLILRPSKLHIKR